MEFNKQTVKALLGVVCGGIAFAAALLHLDVVAGAAEWLLGILSPLLLGCAIAFILNVPMRAMERCLFPHAKKANKLRRPLALLLTVAAVSAVLALAGMVIVPGVRDAVTSIAAQVPEAFERLQESAARFQVNGSAVLGREGLLRGLRVRRWLRAGLIDYVASDSHDCQTRKTCMQSAYAALEKSVGAEYAGQLVGLCG